MKTTLLEPQQKVPITYDQYAKAMRKYGWRINSEGVWSMPADVFMEKLSDSFLPNVRFHLITPLLSRER